MGTTRRRLLATAGLAAGGVLSGSAAASGAPLGRRLPFHRQPPRRHHDAATGPPAFWHLRPSPGHGRISPSCCAPGARQPLGCATAIRSVRSAAIPTSAPVDTGEAYGLQASRLTVTIGLGQSLFDGRFGLRRFRPQALADLPAFRGTASRRPGAAETSASRPAPTTPRSRSMQSARWRGSGAVSRARAGRRPGSTPRLTGARAETSSDSRTARTTSTRPTRRRCAATSGSGAAMSPPWMRGGTYLVTRRIRIRIERWGRQRPRRAGDRPRPSQDVRCAVRCPLGVRTGRPRA